MIQFLCFFMPAFLATYLFEKNKEYDFSLKKTMFVYISFVGIINIICLSTIAIVFKHPDYIVNSQIFSVGFSLKYILFSLFVAAILLIIYEMLRRCTQERQDNKLGKKERIKLALMVNLFFVFTTLIFIPYDVFFANTADFQFAFLDFWWIILSFALGVFAILIVISIILPEKVFIFMESFVFSITFLCYIQRMFLNFFVTSLVGEQLKTGEHPLWSSINLLIWLGIIAFILFASYTKKSIWTSTLYIVSIGLIVVQSVALIFLLSTEDLFGSEHLTTEGLYELATDNNIIVFILDYYDFYYLDLVKESDPDFYDCLEGFTYFDNTASVYSRSYPSNTYLLTGVELEDYHIAPYDECVNKAFEEGSFLPDLKNLGFEINIYTNESYVGENGYALIENYSNEKYYLSYWGTITGILKCSFYFEMPYIVKPFFWTYEINSIATNGNSYIMDDAKLYAELLEDGLTVSNVRSMYKYIHMFGGHAPYTLDENGNRITEGVDRVQQWKGCMNIVYEYLEQMKTLEKYDDATIIITADHGNMIETGDLKFAIGPIMFVKPAHAPAKELTISHAPVSHSDIFATIIDAAEGDYNIYGKPIFTIDESEKRLRTFHYSEMIDWLDNEIIDYMIPEDVRDFKNWKIKSTKKVLDSIYGVHK